MQSTVVKRLKDIKFYFLVFGMLTIIVAMMPFVVTKKNLPCPDRTNFPFSGTDEIIDCIKDGGERYWYQIKRLSKVGYAYNYIVLKPDRFPQGVYVEAFSRDESLIYFQTKKEPNRFSAPYASTAAGLNVVVSGQFSKDTVDISLAFKPVDIVDKSIYLRLIPKVVSNGEESEHLLPTLASRSSRIWIYLLTFFLAATAVIAIILYKKERRLIFGALALAIIFFLAFIFHDRTYRGMGGYIDSGDDSYYVGYVQSLLTQKSLFYCNNYVSFSGKTVGCYGLPGTAIALLPGALMGSILRGKDIFSPLDIWNLRGMRLLSMSYSFTATILLFLVFQLLFQTNTLNIVLSAALIWGTSLSKWTFDRSIFTHSIEMFFLTAMLLTLALFYRQKLTLVKAGLFLGLLNGCISLVRGEYLIVAVLVPVLTIFYKAPHERVAPSKKLKFIASYFIALMPFFLFYMGILSKTGDYGTIATSQISYDVVVNNLKRVSVNLLEPGLLYYCGLAALIFFSIKDADCKKLAQISLTYVVSYFFATLCFHDALGAEWQHRYFLKQYPFCFFGIILIAVNYKQLFWPILVMVCYSLAKQRMSYLDNVSSLNETKYELFYRFMTDTHLLAHGFDPHYYGGYALCFGFLFVTIIIIYYEHKKIKNHFYKIMMKMYGGN